MLAVVEHGDVAPDRPGTWMLSVPSQDTVARLLLDGREVHTRTPLRLLKALVA